MLRIVSVQAASYKSTTGELFLPSLVIGSKTFTDVIIKLNPDGTYRIKNSTESALPFRCASIFSEATLDSVRTVTSSNDVDSILGCRWISQTTSESDTNIAQNFMSYQWIDSKCSTLSLGFDKSSNLIISEITLTKGDCNTTFNVRSHDHIYDLNSKLFLLVSVAIDDTAIASEVLIKFHTNNRYELINFVLTPQENPPVICRSLTEAQIQTISPTMSPGEVSSILHCSQRPIKSFVSSQLGTQVIGVQNFWLDHECNQLSVGGGAKQFSLNKSGGCNSFEGQ